VDLLLEKEADANAQGGYYGNALQAACRHGDVAIVWLLLKKGADVNTSGGYYSNALQAACESGDVAVVRLLLEKGAGVNTQGGYYGNALQTVCRHGDVATARLLLDKGADANARGRYGNAFNAISKWRPAEEVQSLVEVLSNTDSNLTVKGDEEMIETFRAKD
jgi:ankyrin repeat protein